MSQHDLDISTGDANTGLTFRAAVNSALQALGSQQSGASAPGITYPYLLWADTAIGLLKQRNGANTAWIVIGTLDQPYWGLRMRKNFIINGTGIVNQRVTALTLVKDTYGFGADRLSGMATGSLVSAGTFGQNSSSACGRTGYAFSFSGVTLTGTGILYARYRMEAKDARTFKSQVASFSAQVLHNVGSNLNYRIYVRKANAADNFSAVTAISDSGAISVPSGTAMQIKFENISTGDCSNGIEIEIKVECGAIATKNFEFTELQLEVCSVATEFEFESYGEELALCQRYYVNLCYPSSVN